MGHPSLTAATVMLALQSPVAIADCEPTPHRTTGTHYEPVTEQRGDVGRGVQVQGRILSAVDCKPVADAKIAHWQAGEDGRYQDRLRAFLFSDAQGGYGFETEWPNLWPAHIHFIVAAEGYEVLETQWIGDERSKKISFDMVLRRISSD